MLSRHLMFISYNPDEIFRFEKISLENSDFPFLQVFHAISLLNFKYLFISQWMFKHFALYLITDLVVRKSFRSAIKIK